MSYTLTDKQLLYAGKKVRLELHHLRDDEGAKHIREVCVHPGAVVILPLLADGRVVLIRNLRYTVNKYLLELPAGTLEPGESPMNCAGRELVEETNYIAARLKPLGSFYASPGVLTEKMYAFVATDLSPHQGEKDETEEIEVMPMTFADAIEAVRTGEIEDAKTIATLLMYDRFHTHERPA
jgi:ADP-ribose pyrophosphatase